MEVGGYIRPRVTQLQLQLKPIWNFVCLCIFNLDFQAVPIFIYKYIHIEYSEYGIAIVIV